MKVLLLSDINSSHTKRWALDLSNKGIKVAIFSFVSPTEDWFSIANIKVSSLSLKKKAKGGTTTLSKIKYLVMMPKLKKFVKSFKPDIVHAHFLTSYGVLAHRLNFHPFIISVWGSDVFFDLENHKVLQKKMKETLKNADLVCSTSKVMTEPVIPYRKDVKVIPFGVNTDQFKLIVKKESSKIIIGTVKSLKPIYGIDKLIKAFSSLTQKLTDLELELHIYGDGPEKEKYIELTNSLSVQSKVKFLGQIANNKVPDALNTFDIFANLSEFESFGVSVLEASACGIPVIASNIGGLKEVVVQEKTGFLVDQNNENEIIEKLSLLVLNPNLRNTLGANGRDFVLNNYDINQSTKMMIEEYTRLI